MSQITYSTKGMVWELGKPLNTGKVKTFEQFLKMGKIADTNAYDGPTTTVNGKRHYHDDLIIHINKSGDFRKKERMYVFYVVDHYTNPNNRQRAELVLPGPKTGRLYGIWMQMGTVHMNYNYPGSKWPAMDIWSLESRRR